MSAPVVPCSCAGAETLDDGGVETATEHLHPAAGGLRLDRTAVGAIF